MQQPIANVSKEQLIVSLTSFPTAIQYAVPAIESVLAGSVLPDKIVLYLTAAQFPTGAIPTVLQTLKADNPIFDIRFYEENIRSYTKLIPALRDFPDATIVTVDDDVRYDTNMLRDLVRLHRRYPEAVIGHHVKRFKADTPYRAWRRYNSFRYLLYDLKPRFDNVQTGVGGVLYPPRSLKEEMLDSKLFMEMAPTVDDMWFWAAAVANGTKIAPVPFGCSKPVELGKPDSISLKRLNIGQTDVNRAAVEKIFETYPDIRQRVAGNR